jgi:hypothetical protein
MRRNRVSAFPWVEVSAAFDAAEAFLDSRPCRFRRTQYVDYGQQPRRSMEIKGDVYSNDYRFGFYLAISLC